MPDASSNPGKRAREGRVPPPLKNHAGSGSQPLVSGRGVPGPPAPYPKKTSASAYNDSGTVFSSAVASVS